MTSATPPATSATPPSGPLVGVRVLELAGIGPGPFAAMLLADLGRTWCGSTAPAGRRSGRTRPGT